VSVLGVHNYRVRAGDRDYLAQRQWRRIDRDIVYLPDVVLNDVEIDYMVDLPMLLRPVVDAFWQAGGWDRSPNYDADGRWIPER